MMELGSIPEGFLGSCAVFQEDFIDTEIRIIDTELIHSLLIIRDYRILQFLYLTEEIAALTD